MRLRRRRLEAHPTYSRYVMQSSAWDFRFLVVVNRVIASGGSHNAARGKSGLHWARCQVTPGLIATGNRGDGTDSATENTPPTATGNR